MDLPRRLGLVDSIAIVIGIVIGGGIFLVPNLVARSLASVPMIMAVWIFAGVVSFFGALACAELGSAFPSTGGQYVFLREAYGPFAGFLCGWSMFTVARSAQVAWMAMIFALYLSYFVRLGGIGSRVVGLALIALFSWINYRGVRASAVVQNSFTAAKLVGAVIIIGGAFLLGHPPAAPASVAAPAAASAFSLSSFGVALIACLLAYDGWVQLSFVAGEIRNPKRNVMAALAIGSAVVIAIYLLANLAYLRVMTVPQIAASDHVGADAAERVLGPAGGWGYPVTPLLFVAITAWFILNMLVTRPGPAFAGLGLILLGIPVYRLWR
jgi:APA family basic amino acid/polyamine antiporter